MPVSAARLAAWQDSTEWPMAALAVLFLAAYAIDVLAQSLSPGWHRTLQVVEFVIWAIFCVEFLIRLGLAHTRGRYLVRHLPDVLMLALPFLRTMRILRLVPLLRALNRWVADSLRGKFVIYGGTAAVLLVFTGALAVLDAERGRPGATITSFGVALWWAVVTICTVGYGDYTPVTTSGRIVAIIVMIGGVMLVAAVTASFATWLIDRLRAEEVLDRAATERDLLSVNEKLDRLERELVELHDLLRERTPLPGDS